MSRIYNQASISYNYANTTGNATSNIASTNLQDPFSITKYALDSSYREGDEITYIVNIQNNSLCHNCPITLTDNLGSFVDCNTTITPLTYVDCSAKVINPTSNTYIDITPIVNKHSIIFDIPIVDCQKCLLLIYKARVNEYAPIDVNSQINNTITATACKCTVTSDTTITAKSYADVEIFKAMTPGIITCGSPITYTFTLSNYGNTSATNVEFTDQFTPAPNNINVYVNGTLLSPSEYTYTNGLLIIPSEYNLTIPKATITRSTTTNEIEITPSIVTIEVVGTL